MRKRDKQTQRVYSIGELDGFYVDRQMDRAVHITFEEVDTVVIDIFDSARAAYSPVGEAFSTVEINLKSGRAKILYGAA